MVLHYALQQLGFDCAARYGDYRWYMWICAGALIAIAPFACFVFLWPDPVQALSMHLVITILMHVSLGPVLAMVQGLAGSRRRAMSQAINILVTNLIALSLGPLIVGRVSDLLRPTFGDMGLGYGILYLMLIAYGLASICFYFSGLFVGTLLTNPESLLLGYPTERELMPMAISVPTSRHV